MQEKIEILDTDLMKQKDKLRLIEYWAGIVNFPMGWHYWLDFIWILNHLEQINLAPGSWIMDAGAGNGILQYILAAKGYNVISLDFAEREFLPIAKRIFKMNKQEYIIDNPGHMYRNFINYKKKRFVLNRNKILKTVSHPVRPAKNIVKYFIYDILAPFINLNIWKEFLKAGMIGKNYGKIVYARADFTNLNGFKDDSFDCIVSVSALEHNNHEEIGRAVDEFLRILKKPGYMLFTASAAKDKDWYFQPARGWCFCEESLKKIFNLNEGLSNFVNYEELLKKLENSKEIKNRISRYYFGTADCGLPYGIYKPKYQPVGIVKIKR